MRHFLLLALAALSAASFAVAGRNVASGTYRLVPDDATRAFCRRHRIPLPTGKLVIREDRTFALTVTDDEGVHRTMGKYALKNDQLEFHIEEGEGLDLPREMHLDDEGLSGNGAFFERIEEPPPVPRPPRGRQPKVDVFEPIRAVVAPLPPMRAVDGVWTLRRRGAEDRSTRFTFNRDGTFQFTGPSADSRGRYRVEGGCIELTWTQIDGEPVLADQVVRKRLPLDPDGFFVDEYRYERRR